MIVRISSFYCSNLVTRTFIRCSIVINAFFVDETHTLLYHKGLSQLFEVASLHIQYTILYRPQREIFAQFCNIFGSFVVISSRSDNTDGLRVRGEGNYSGCHWKINQCCFMKQKYHFKIGELQYENATMPLSSSGIHTTH